MAATKGKIGLSSKYIRKKRDANPLPATMIVFFITVPLFVEPSACLESGTRDGVFRERRLRSLCAAKKAQMHRPTTSRRNGGLDVSSRIPWADACLKGVAHLRPVGTAPV